MLLYGSESDWDALDPRERDAALHRHDVFTAAVGARGCAIVAGEALASVDAATTLRRAGEDVTVTEGPFAETAEQLGGFYVLDAPDLDVVTDLVRELPEYTIEVRPVLVY